MLLAAVRTGATRKMIAERAGISPRTLHRFLLDAEKAQAKDERGGRLNKVEKELCQFCRDFRLAEADVELAALRVITKAAMAGDWRAAMAFLERRFPEHWSRRRIALRLQTLADEGDCGHHLPAAPFQRRNSQQELAAELKKRGLPTGFLARARDDASPS